MSEVFRGPRDQLRIKICGLTSAADAEEAIACGADALGFNFYRGSKRYIDLAAERSWLARLPSDVVKVALLVNPTREEAERIAGETFIDVLQLHGEETPEFCAQLRDCGLPFIKAVAVENAKSLERLERFSTPFILLDSRSEGFGGSGKAFDWKLAEGNLAREFKLFLAGGLTPANVAEAVARTNPFGVDVTTGVESSPGRKDRSKMRAFIAAARGARS